MYSILEIVDPVITFVSPPKVTNHYPVLKWLATTEMTFECSLDNGAYEPCGDGRSGHWNGNNVLDGPHVLEVRGTDSNGNVLVVSSIRWNVSRGRFGNISGNQLPNNSSGKNCFQIIFLVSTPALDLVFAVDGSNALTSGQFDKLKDVMKEMIDTYTISPTATNVGVIEFSDRSREVIRLTESYDKKVIYSMIDGIRQSGGNRRVTDEAIETAASRLFERSGRVGASRALVIIAAGKSTGSKPLREAIKPLQKKGIRIYVVGIGDGVDRDEIDSIVPTKDNVFPTTPDNPGDVVDDIVQVINKDVRKSK